MKDPSKFERKLLKLIPISKLLLICLFMVTIVYSQSEESTNANQASTDQKTPAQSEGSQTATPNSQDKAIIYTHSCQEMKQKIFDPKFIYTEKMYTDCFTPEELEVLGLEIKRDKLKGKGLSYLNEIFEDLMKNRISDCSSYTNPKSLRDCEAYDNSLNHCCHFKNSTHSQCVEVIRSITPNHQYYELLHEEKIDDLINKHLSSLQLSNRTDIKCSTSSSSSYLNGSKIILFLAFLMFAL